MIFNTIQSKVLNYSKKTRNFRKKFLLFYTVKLKGTFKVVQIFTKKLEHFEIDIILLLLSKTVKLNGTFLVIRILAKNLEHLEKTHFYSYYSKQSSLKELLCSDLYEKARTF